MTQPKKLIEVAMPIKEISAESVRDKSIRHGHISTLHLWWARRPLPVCRAVVFASLVPDPEDEHCPQAFKDAVSQLLGKQENNTDPYKPYDDIPYTSAIDKMEDTLRNRLMMFIGKFSEKYIQAAKQGKKTAAKFMLSDASLIKWDNKNDDTIIGKARKLIWVAHNASSGKTAKDLLAEFDTAYQAIKDAENGLYTLPDRHLETGEVNAKEAALKHAIDAFQDRMPKVFDPFAGGGAIPLEAARLGCRSYGNDINPVAHIVQLGSLDYPQKFGKGIILSKSEFVNQYGLEYWQIQPQENKITKNGENVAIEIDNRLSFDIRYYSEILVKEVKEIVDFVYPKNKNTLGYLWAKTARCGNPTCATRIPLLRSLNAVDKDDKIYGYEFKRNRKDKSLDVSLSNNKNKGEPFVKRGNLICPECQSVTAVNEVKTQIRDGEGSDQMLAIILKSKNSKHYISPNQADLIDIEKITISKPVPFEKMYRNSAGGDTHSWGIDTYDKLFNKRQLFVLSELANYINVTIPKKLDGVDKEYKRALLVYLSIAFDRLTDYYTSFCAWSSSREEVKHVFGRQAIPMIFDYAEIYPFSGKMGSYQNQIDWVIRYIESESSNSFWTNCINSSSGDNRQFNEGELNACITDPPYYDAIAYADISDFFYVWLKRTIGDKFPLNFAFPTTPKTEECTALKHHHENDNLKAKKHFEDKLTQIFEAINFQLRKDSILSIMFAHQSTEAWTTLCKSVLNSNNNITSSWAIDTEYTVTGLKSKKAFLSSSVTVSCRPTFKGGYGEYREVKKAIEKTVAKEVEELYRLGFRGADLLTACFGQAVSEFGKYETVEKADGSEVTVAELLEMARENAFNALLKGFDGDDFTKFYIGWLQLYGFVESDFDDAAKFSRVGLSINVQDLFTNHILIKNGNKQALGGFADRLTASKNLGEKANSHLIDQVHRAMYLYQGTNRGTLLEYIHRIASNPDSPFWRVLTSLCEILPVGSDDHKQATGLITNKESLIRESETAERDKTSQTSLFE